MDDDLNWTSFGRISYLMIWYSPQNFFIVCSVCYFIVIIFFHWFCIKKKCSESVGCVSVCIHSTRVFGFTKSIYFFHIIDYYLFIIFQWKDVVDNTFIFSYFTLCLTSIDYKWHRKSTWNAWTDILRMLFFLLILLILDTERIDFYYYLIYYVCVCFIVYYIYFSQKQNQMKRNGTERKKGKIVQLVFD